MRPVVNSTFVSLDGVINHMEAWHFTHIDDEVGHLSAEQLSASDALLMGRDTYEGYASAWPNRSGEYADKINTVAKYVASTTLEDPKWENTTVIQGDLAAEVRALKQQPGKGILVHGFGPVSLELLEHGLLDELHLWIHPHFAGIGDTNDMLFNEGNNEELKLIGTRTLNSGIVILSYRPLNAGAKTVRG